MNDTNGNKSGLDLLRVPFPENQVSQLPKPTISNDEWKKLPKAKCRECGGYHASTNTIHLSYVGHAALTDRLLDADPNWNWEPLALDSKGIPVLDENGGMWIKLTVCGVTRYGYGDAQGKTGGNAVKERIGDALRNAAMRFGAALDLWHKGDLHVDEDEPEPPKKQNGKPPAKPAEPTPWPEVVQRAEAAIVKCENANDCSALLDKFARTFESAPDAIHDQPFRRMIDRMLAMSAAGKLDARAADALCEVVNGRLRVKSETEVGAAERF